MRGFDRNTISSLEGIASYGCVFLELQPGKKMPTRGWDHFEYLHDQRGESRIDLAFEWLKHGSGVGYLFRNRLAAVDCDSRETVQRVVRFGQARGIRFPMTKTPSGGRHFLFELPPTLDHASLKHHVCHPEENGVVVPWDFKLGTRTMLVAPGTVKFDSHGNEIGRYKATPWVQPPVLDPRELAPGLAIFRDTKPFLRDPRPLLDRTMGAMTYLRLHAPVSQGQRGRAVMHEVARRLVSWFDLDPRFALHLMTVDKPMSKGSGVHVAWNNRCVDEQGKPYPWREETLLAALCAATDEPSEFGVQEYLRIEEREFFRWSLESFFSLLEKLPDEAANKKITTKDLFEFFLAVTGVRGSYFTIDEFGAELHGAIASGRVKKLVPHRTAARRGYKGADLKALSYAHDRYEAAQASMVFLSDACNF